MLTRESAQRRAVELSRENKALLLEWATGLGKSRASIEILKDIRANKTSPGALSVLLVVGEKAHEDNWTKEFNKWLSGHNGRGIEITFVCYASLKKYKEQSFDVIIFDEAHHLASEMRQIILYSLNYEKAILLTATISSTLKLELTIHFRGLKVYTISLMEAIDCGIIPEPKVYLVSLTLNNIVRDQEVIIKRGKGTRDITCEFPERWKYLTKKKDPELEDICVHIKCTQKEKYDYLETQIEFYRNLCFKNKGALWAKTKWMNLCSERKRLLGEYKTEPLRILIDQLEKASKRFVCFCGSISQAKELGASTCVHSKRKDNEGTIRAFNEKEIDSLFAVGMLQEGMNLCDIEVGIIAQLDGNERGVTQKIGRVVRGKEPVIYILYYEGTRDEEYKEGAIELIDDSYVQEINGFDYGTELFR